MNMQILLCVHLQFYNSNIWIQSQTEITDLKCVRKYGCTVDIWFFFFLLYGNSIICQFLTDLIQNTFFTLMPLLMLHYVKTDSTHWEYIYI